MNVVELGKVDLLVEQGFYSNRTDFIRAAIRSQLATHNLVIEQVVNLNSFSLGVSLYSKKDLEKLAASNQMISIKVVGMLVLSEDIDEDLAKRTINSIKVL